MQILALKKMAADPVVVDIGSSCSRIGISGDAKPQYLVDRPLKSAVWNSRLQDINAYSGVLEQSTLFQAADNTALIVESVAETDNLHTRTDLCDVMFGTYKCSAISFQYAPVLSCFSNARQTALVLDMSAGGCTASAVLDGWCLNQTNVERSELGGMALDTWLSRVQIGPSMTTSSLGKLHDQKARRESQTFVLPDGTEVWEKVSNALFDPSVLDNISYVPLHELVFTAATKQNTSEARKLFMNNVVVCGGLSCTSGVVQRLTNELQKMSRMDHPRVICCGLPDRHLTSWIGGSILSSLSIFKDVCLSRAEYEESGQQAILRKCA